MKFVNLEIPPKKKEENDIKENSSVYIPNLPDMGFEQGNLKKPEKWEPSGKFKDEEEIVRQLEFNKDEMMKGAIDDKGNIRNGHFLFSDLFDKKILLAERGQWLIDNNGDSTLNEYMLWMASEMQNDLSESINKSVYKKDIEKIIIIKFINDLIAGSLDLNGEIHVDSYVKNSLISRFKDEDVSVLEKSYIKDVVYKISDLEDIAFWDDNSIQRFERKEKFENEEKSFLEQEIGFKFNPQKYHDKSFNKFRFSFNETQKDVIDGGYYYGDLIIPYNYRNDTKLDFFDKEKFQNSFEGYLTSLVAPGILGVYSLGGFLVGWKEIKNLKNESGNEINDLFDVKNESQTNSLEELALFKVSSSLGFRDYLNDSIGVNLSDLDLKNQFYFLNYIQNKTEKSINDFSLFINKSKDEKDKINKFRTFLSIEQGGNEMGDKILTLGEKLPEEIAKIIFAKYGEIINKADNTEEEIRKIFGNESIPDRVLSSVKETLLKRGAKMLSDLGDKVIDEKFKINEQEILNELDEIKEETIILGKSFEKLYRKGINVPIEDVTEIKEISTSDITKEQKQQLIKAYENGRPEETYKNKAHLKLLVDEFTEELNDENISVLEISFKGDTIIIAVIDKKDKDTLYVGGLTFINEVRNAAVAEASMRHVLERFKDFNIKALVDSTNPILAMYQKRFGFKITKKLDSPEEMSKNVGELYYEIEKSKEEPKEVALSATRREGGKENGELEKAA